MGLINAAEKRKGESWTSWVLGRKEKQEKLNKKKHRALYSYGLQAVERETPKNGGIMISNVRACGENEGPFKQQSPTDAAAVSCQAD